MSTQTIITGVLLDDAVSYSYLEVCEHYGISEQTLLEMLQCGLFSTHITPIHQLQFDHKMLGRIAAACRLQNDLDINMPGVVLALELLDELATVREELHILRRQVESLSS